MQIVKRTFFSPVWWLSKAKANLSNGKLSSRKGLLHISCEIKI